MWRCATDAPRARRSASPSPAPGRRAGLRGQRRLGATVQCADGGPRVAALQLDALVDAQGLGAGPRRGHALDIASGANAPAGTGDDDAAHLAVMRGPRELHAQRFEQGAREGVAHLGPVQRERQHAGVEIGEQVVGSGVANGHGGAGGG